MSGLFVVNADDFGLCRGATEGIVRAHLDGVVTSASVVTTTADYAHAVETCRRECPDLGLGLHLTLSAGRPVSEPSQVPLLVDQDGYLRWRFGSLLRAAGVERRHDLLQQVSRELEAQFDRLQADGIQPDHIDSERHVHQIPGLFEIVVAAAKKRGVRWIRLGREIGWRHARAQHLPALLGRGGVLKHVILSMLSARNRKRVEEMQCPGHFASYLYSGRLHEILESLCTRPVARPVEIMVHPGIPALSRDLDLGNRPLERYLQSADRLEELNACIAAREWTSRDRLATFAGLDA